MLLGIILMTSLLSFTIYTKQNLVDNELKSKPKEYLDGGKLVKDTISGSFSTLWNEHHHVELVASLEDTVIIEGYEDILKTVVLDIKNDTLFIVQKPFSADTSYLLEAGAYYKIIIGAKGLENIVAKNMGAVKNKIVALQEDSETEKKRLEAGIDTIRNNNMNIVLINGGKVHLIIEAQTINIQNLEAIEANWNLVNRIHTSSHARLAGKVEQLNLNFNGGTIMAGQCLAQKVSIKSKGRPKHQDRATIEVKVDELLEVELNNGTDVIYTGQPKIRKIERSSGRVLDGNYYGEKVVLPH